MPTARLNVRVTARASRNQLGGFVDEVLQVRVTAAPVDGRANDAVVRLLADHLRVPKSAVRIVAGAAAREKLVAVDGVSVEEVRRRLGG